MSEKLLAERFMLGDHLNVRLERAGKLTTWEAQPVYRHQAEIFRIQTSIRSRQEGSGCGCVHVADLSLLFPDGSEKRPDISLFCRVPDEEETAVTLLPEAVIEVISKDYEAKDYEVGVPFYLAQGVKDVITFDPRSKEVRHYRREGVTYHASPIEIILECGCVCTV